MKTLILILSLTILGTTFSLDVFGQQEPLSTMYWNNYSYFNPAMSGVAYKHEANVTWRNQWNKINGAPNTLFVNYGMNLAEKHGIGVNYSYETIGFAKTNQVKLSYNYQLKLDTDRKLVFGTAFSVQNYKLNSEWNTPEMGNDPYLPAAVNFTNYNVDLGVAYYGNQIIAGVGITQLPLYQNPASSSVFYYPAQHLFGNFRYEADFMASSKLIFETRLRTDFVKYSQDFNIGYNWNGILEGGVGYRTSDAIIFNLTGIIAKKYRLGYSYDITTNKLSSISRGSHEITLGLRIPN